jgi:hypothetical protein
MIMSETKSELLVTRQEFYFTIAIVFIFMGSVEMTASRAGEAGVSFVPALFVAITALGCGILYLFMALRQRIKEGS